MKSGIASWRLQEGGAIEGVIFRGGFSLKSIETPLRTANTNESNIKAGTIVAWTADLQYFDKSAITIKSQMKLPQVKHAIR